MKGAPESDSGRGTRPLPPKNPARSKNGGAAVIGSETPPNPIDECHSGLRDLFRSARFNRTDELDVYAGDFRSFRDLGPIVTADMRHQMERLPCLPDEQAGLRSNDRRPINVAGSTQCLAGRRELPEMTDAFGQADPIRKIPRLCLRRASRSGGCRLCLNACPFNAVQGAGGGIEVDFSLCRICGVCEAVCPAGALQLQDPARGALLLRMQNDLAGRVQSGGPAPTLVLHESSIRTTGSMEPFSLGRGPNLWFEVAGIGRIGVEVLLAAVAWGAFRVVIWLPSAHPAAVKASLHRQVRMAGIILEGLGQSPDRVSVAEGVVPRAPGPPSNAAAPALFAPPEDKRTLLQLAVGHLFGQRPPAAQGVDLPPGSPCGEVRVAAQRCTFCMACAGVCPKGALSGGQGLPCLRFVEARCVQCGLCAESCPEQAITLAPRLLFDSGAAESFRVLAEETPFACIRCGRPFASHRMVERMTYKLEGHWMYRRPEDLRRLQMCSTCRVRDLYCASGGE
jgi:ferredoxin